MTTLKNLTKIDFRATKVSFSRSFGLCSQVGGSSGVFLLSLGSFMAFRNGHVFRGRPKRWKKALGWRLRRLPRLEKACRFLKKYYSTTEIPGCDSKGFLSSCFCCQMLSIRAAVQKPADNGPATAGQRPEVLGKLLTTENRFECIFLHHLSYWIGLIWLKPNLD